MVKKQSLSISYAIHSFMFKELSLGGNELLVFAIIYSFSKGERGIFYGTHSYLARMSGVSVSTVRRALLALIKKGYIEKFEVGGDTVYRATVDEESIYQKKETDGPSNAAELILDNDGARDADIRESLGKKAKKPIYKFHSVGRDGSVSMTAEQYKRLLTLVGSEMLTNYIRRLELLIQKKGYRTFNPYSTIKKWINEDASV